MREDVRFIEYIFISWFFWFFLFFGVIPLRGWLFVCLFCYFISIMYDSVYPFLFALCNGFPLRRSGVFSEEVDVLF